MLDRQEDIFQRGGGGGEEKEKRKKKNKTITELSHSD